MLTSALLMYFTFLLPALLLVYASENGTVSTILADSCNWEQHCSECQLETLPDGKYLDCSKLLLTNISVEGNCSLMLLNLSSNLLKDVPQLDTSLKVEWMDLSHNNIKLLGKSALVQLKHQGLKVLLLNHNRILNIRSFELISDVLLDLQLVELSNNPLGYVQNFGDFKWLHLSSINKTCSEGSYCGNASYSLSENKTIYRSGNSSQVCSPCNYYYPSNLEHICEYYECIIQCVDNSSQSIESLNDSTVCPVSQEPENFRGRGSLFCKINSTITSEPSLEVSTLSTNKESHSEFAYTISSDSSGEDNENGTTSVSFKNPLYIVFILTGIVVIALICATLYRGWQYCKQRRIHKRYDKWLAVYTPKNRSPDDVSETYVSHRFGDLTPSEDQEDVATEVELTPLAQP